MAIFPVLECDSVVQIGDKIRFDASQSFASKGSDPITTMTVSVEDGVVSPVSVFSSSLEDRFIDWIYSGSSREVDVILTVGDGTTTSSFTKTINVLTEADDALFSNDTDIKTLEPDIIKWLPQDRSSYKFIHREAQKKILDYLDEMGVVDDAGAKLTKAAIIDVSEVRSWSRDLALSLIFFGINNSKDDIFLAKAEYYKSEAKKRSDRAVLRLDLDGDGLATSSEILSMNSADLIRS